VAIHQAEAGPTRMGAAPTGAAPTGAAPTGAAEANWYPNVVDGRPVPRSGGAAILELVDPSTGVVHGSAPESSAAEVDQAVRAATAAFSSWSRQTPATRSALLLEVASLLEANADALCALEVLDTGKPVNQMTEDEMPAILDQVRFFAGACRALEGRSAGEYAEGITSSVRREAVGVCGQITPWNYPLMMAVWKWAPAVAAGNTVVLKPSELTPASTSVMAQLLGTVLPPGVVNVVCGGAQTGESLVRHPSVAMVSLTGSVRAGRAVAALASERLARVHLELGGNAPVVVFADADLAAAAVAIAGAGFYNAGQDCTAASRVLVESSVALDLVDLLQAAASEARCGAPDEEGIAFGPMISEAQRGRVEGLLSRLSAPAQVVCGGGRVDRPGFYFPATIVTGVVQSDELVQEEIFGPVITMQTFTSDHDAVALANGVPQGLTASVWTADVGRAMRLARDLDFGAVSVNAHAPMASEMPHGGFGVSGYGKDLSVYGLEDYTRLKHVAVAL
jgi:betaine-aldehyde dehydrogenase